MLLDYQNTSVEVDETRPTLALLPIGATERCGEHLPIGTTIRILDVLARRVAETLSGAVYLLPTMPLGTSGLHVGTAGTVAVEWPTLMQVVYDLVESLLAQGICRVALLVGLGGAAGSTARPQENEIVKTAVRQLNYDHPELDAIWLQPFAVAGEALQQILASSEEDVHAGELVTSLMLHLDPSAVKGRGIDFVPEVDRSYLNTVAFEKLCPGGVWGRPSLASAEKGRQALEAAVECSVAYIEQTLAHLATIKKRKDGPMVVTPIPPTQCAPQ